jgi:hypothetical protein
LAGSESADGSVAAAGAAGLAVFSVLCFASAGAESPTTATNVVTASSPTARHKTAARDFRPAAKRPAPARRDPHLGNTLTPSRGNPEALPKIR